LIASSVRPFLRAGLYVFLEELQGVTSVYANLPGVKTFVKLGNIGTTAPPDYMNFGLPGMLDVYGIGGYRCRTANLGNPAYPDGCDIDVFNRYVQAARDAHIPPEKMAPTYQAFAGWSNVFIIPSAEATAGDPAPLEGIAAGATDVHGLFLWPAGEFDRRNCHRAAPAGGVPRLEHAKPSMQRLTIVEFPLRSRTNHLDAYRDEIADFRLTMR
jgi:hypothetical protein